MTTYGLKDARLIKVFNSITTEQQSKQLVGRGEVEVLVLGLPRSATSSLQTALESEWLNFTPVHHMSEILPYGPKRKLLLNAAREPDREKRQKLLAEVLRGYNVTTDFPTIAFSKDLMDMYPNAKIVLNHRKDGKVWAKSVSESIAFLHPKTFLYTALWFPVARDTHYMMRDLWKVAASQFGKPDPFFGGDPNYGPVEFWDDWQDHIRTEAEKRGQPILDWQPQDGWKPLCEFLGRPVPPTDVPFPKTNETTEILKVKRAIYTLSLLAWSTFGAITYLGITRAIPLIRGCLDWLL